VPPLTRPRRTILAKLLAIMLVPATLFLFGSYTYFYFEARAGLEDEMGRRLVGIARSVSSQVDARLVMGFTPGDERGGLYQDLAHRLRRLAEANEAERIYLVRPDHTIMLDTDPAGRIGQKMYRLAGDRQELRRVADGKTAASTMFEAQDGRLFKAGYAPLLVEEQVVGLVGVDAGVKFFDRLGDTRRNLILIGLIGLASLAVVGVLFTRRLVRPIRNLTSSARRIGEGDLESAIERMSNDEVGFLAETMNQMRLSIVERDRYLQMLQRGIAHEVRNPLGGMELYCDILHDELAGRPDLRAHVTKIRREVQGLDEVVNDFLDFTRETTPEARAVNVPEFLSELLLVYCGKCEAQKIEIAKTLAADVEQAVFDPDLLRRALHNLLLNAIQAMPDGGRLTIDVRHENGQLVFQLEDTGMGVPENIRDAVFTPFVTSKDRGTGLGLPFARKIIESHGGSITLESQTGQGTKIRFTLPQPGVGREP